MMKDESVRKICNGIRLGKFKHTTSSSCDVFSFQNLSVIKDEFVVSVYLKENFMSTTPDQQSQLFAAISEFRIVDEDDILFELDELLRVYGG